MDINKKELKEQEIRTMFISPALKDKGWEVPVNIREEYYFTDGRVLVAGSQHSVAEGKKADYFKKRKALDHEIDKTLAEIQRILGIDVKIDE